LQSIKDVILEKDPEQTTGEGSEKPGYNFIIRAVERDYRMQAETKVEQIAWAKAFTVLFELRARVANGLMTSAEV
jgi:hypothetical protein